MQNVINVIYVIQSKLIEVLCLSAYRSHLLLCSVLLFIGFIGASTTGIARISDAATQMCNDLACVLPVVSMLMIIGAGVVYVAGQMMGAETRARANTWATAMLLGAVIGILIVVVAPAVLHTLYADVDVNACTCAPAP